MTTTLERFTFDEATHVGRIDGVFAPSVTQVLVDNGFIDPTRYNEKARQRGTVVHAVLAGLHKGLTLDWAQLHPDLHGYVRSGLALHRDLKLEIIDVEQRLWNPVYRFHGGRDFKARFPGNKRPAIFDYKTGEVEWWTRYQLGAYDDLDGGGNDKYGVKLFADGSIAKLVPFNDMEFYDDVRHFMSYLNTTHRRLLHGVSPLKEILNGIANPGAQQ